MGESERMAHLGEVGNQVLFTGLIVWKLAAGLGLYWFVSNLVGLFQVLWLRREARSSSIRV